MEFVENSGLGTKENLYFSCYPLHFIKLEPRKDFWTAYEVIQINMVKIKPVMLGPKILHWQLLGSHSEFLFGKKTNALIYLNISSFFCPGVLPETRRASDLGYGERLLQTVWCVLFFASGGPGSLSGEESCQKAASGWGTEQLILVGIIKHSAAVTAPVVLLNFSCWCLWIFLTSLQLIGVFLLSITESRLKWPAKGKHEKKGTNSRWRRTEGMFMLCKITQVWSRSARVFGILQGFPRPYHNNLVRLFIYLLNLE